MGLGQKMNCVAFLGNTFLKWTQARGLFDKKGACSCLYCTILIICQSNLPVLFMVENVTWISFIRIDGDDEMVIMFFDKIF